MSYIQSLLIAVLVSVSSWSAASSTLNVFACEAEWAALAHRIGGDKLTIYAATTAKQDAHHIQARPSLIAKARRADLLVCSGADLEVGWLPLLIKKSSNNKIKPNAIGHFMATEQVELLGKLDKVDRSMGDVHAMGNPHVHLEPKRLARIGSKLASRLGQIDPSNNALYANNARQFSAELSRAERKWQPLKQQLAGKRLVVHHDNWVYLTDWLGIKVVAHLEPKPGVPPSTKHLSSLTAKLAKTPANAIIYGSYQDPKAARWLAKKSQLPSIEIPFSVSNWKQPTALIHWMDDVLKRLARATKG
ncbi:MAG: zinc ABC transporter substrate-binding protein [Pseudomonadota bacterium]